MTSIVNLFNDKKSKKSFDDQSTTPNTQQQLEKEDIKKKSSTLKFRTLFGKKDKEKEKIKQQAQQQAYNEQQAQQQQQDQVEQQFDEHTVSIEDEDSGSSIGSGSRANQMTTLNSTSFSSLRSSSTRSMDYNGNNSSTAGNIRSDSFYSQTSETSDITSLSSTNSNGTPRATKESMTPKPPKSSKLKHIYNSLKFKSLKVEKSSSSRSNNSIQSNAFEFIVPNTPLPIFDQQSPPIHFYTNYSISSDYQYFGVPLQILIKRQDNGLSIPILLEKSISFLEGYCHIEDLFFGKVNNDKIKFMRNSFQKTGDFNFYYPDAQDPHDVASLLIEFTASLPDQLLNIELYTAVKNHTSALNSQYGGYWDIQYLVQKLSVESREYLQRLLFFLKKHVSACLLKNSNNPTTTATPTPTTTAIVSTTTPSTIEGDESSNTTDTESIPTPTPQPVAPIKIKLLIDKLSELFTPLFVNYKTHSTLHSSTSTLINCCEDLFVHIDERPMTLAGEFIMIQIKNVIIPPNNLKLNNNNSGNGNATYDTTFWDIGTLYVTNYRAIWKKDDLMNDSDSSILLPEDISTCNSNNNSNNSNSNSINNSNNNNSSNNSKFEIKLYQFEIILSSIIKWENFGKSLKSPTVGSKKFQIFLCYCKNIRFQYLGFSDEMNYKDLEKLNIILAYYINPVTDFGRFFSSVNNEIPRAPLASANNSSSNNLINGLSNSIIGPVAAAAAAQANNSKSGNGGNSAATIINNNIWDIYSPLVEGQRLKLDLDKDWRLVEFLSRDTSTIYPKRILLPNLCSDELLQSYVKKTQSKIPILSWSNVNNKSMLFRICVYNQPITNSNISTGGSLSYNNNVNSNNIILSNSNSSVNSQQQQLNNSSNSTSTSTSVSSSTNSSTTHHNISMSGNNITTSNNLEEPPSPIKKRQLINDQKKENSSSPLSSFRSSSKGSSSGSSKSHKKDSKSSQSNLNASSQSISSVVSDAVDVKLYHLFVNKDHEQQQQPATYSNGNSANNSGSNSPTLNSSKDSNHGGNNVLFQKEIQQQQRTMSSTSLNASSSSVNNNKRSITNTEATLVFTNKVDMNLIAVYDQFKLNSSNIIFLSIPTREQVESCWFELYHSITNFDGSMDAWKSIEESKWINSIVLLLEGCVRVSNLLDQGSSVLLKPPIDSPAHSLDLASTTSLTMILSDPYYRTLDGFLILVEKEWIQFGFPFNNINQHKEYQNLNSNSSNPVPLSTTVPSSSSNISSSSSNVPTSTSSTIGSGSISRNKSGSVSRGSSISTLISDSDKFDSSNLVIPDTIHTDSLSSKKKTYLFNDLYESSVLVNRSFSPIFIQFLDAVWQLQRQFPFHFEFNESLLLFLIKESFSGRFGNFLYSEALRDSERKFLKRSPSIWAYIYQNRLQFINLLYKHSNNSNGANQPGSPVSPRSSMIFKQEDFNEMIKPSCDSDQIILWSSLFTEFINSRESQQISKKLIGKVKCDLVNQKLTFLTIDRCLLGYFTQLTKLNLARNYFNTFPIEIILLGNLTHLCLSDNRIKSIPSSLLKLIGSKLKLQEFDLSCNLLESLHKSIYTISTLNRLVLDHNKLIIIPESISKMKALRVLSVQSNRLSSFPQALSLMVGLEELYVQNNNIRELPLGFFKLRSIKTLDLRNNQIAKFKSHKLDDKNVFLMNEITHFRMGPNPLQKLSNLMFEMKSLVHLELTSCSLSTIPIKLYDLVNLESLYLNQNKLTEIPIDIQRLYKLAVLDLSDNQFTNVPTNAMMIQSLKKLYLQNNSIYNISFNDYTLPLLSELRLDGNKLTYVSPSIGKLTSLVLLNLDRNPTITTLPHTLAQLKKLKSLIINPTNMESPFKELESTDAIMRYLTLQMQHSHFHPRNKLVIISDFQSNSTIKNEFIKNLTTTIITNKQDSSKKKDHKSSNSSSNNNKNIGYKDYLNSSSNSNSNNQSAKKQPIKWEIDYEICPNTILASIASTINTNSFISSPVMVSSSSTITNSSSSSNNDLIGNGGNSGNGNLNSTNPSVYSNSNPKDEISKKKNLTIYIRDIPSGSSNCSQHLFSKRSIYLLIWVLTESEEPTRIYKWLESIKDRCTYANIFIVGIYNSDYSQDVPKDYYSFITPRIEQKCHNLFPNFTFSFINLINGISLTTSSSSNSSSNSNSTGIPLSSIQPSTSTKDSTNNGGVNNNVIIQSTINDNGTMSKLRDEIKYLFLNQKPFGTKVTSSQRLFEKHIKTLQSPFVSKKEMFSIGEMCKLDKIETKSTCELLTELGLLFWSDDYDWVILDPTWLSNTLNSLLTLKQQNISTTTTTTTTTNSTTPLSIASSSIPIPIPNSTTTTTLNLDSSMNDSKNDDLLSTLSNKIINNGGVKKKDIILMSNLESIWNDIPTRLYPFLLTLAKKFNIAYQIDNLYDPTTWGYIYPSPYSSSNNLLSNNNNNNNINNSSNGHLQQPSINLNRLSISNGSPSLRSISIRSTGIGGGNNSNNSSPMKFSNLNLSPIRNSNGSNGSGSSSNLSNTSSSNLLNLLSPLKNLQLQQKLDQLKQLNEKVIFLPNELPDHPPISIDKMFNAYGGSSSSLTDEPRIVCRIFQFDQKIPTSLFPRLLSQLYMFCSIKYSWKTGVVLENCYLSFPVARRFPMSPNIKNFRRSSTISVMGSDDLVFIQLLGDNKIEISSSKMCRHILQIFESILESYNELPYTVYIPCMHCIETSSKPEFLFSLDQIQSSVIKGKTYISCPIHSLIPIKLSQLAPDLTMNDLRHKLIDFKEVELGEQIGEGGTATVFKGKWRNVDVAIKMLKTDMVGNDFSKVFAEYRREIFCLSSFIHDNILDLKGFCLEPLCIITEFQSGGNLYDYIHDSTKPMDWTLRIKIAKDIAASLQTLHDSRPSIVHRDLKSPNILLSTTDPSTMECHLCDFSLSGFSTTVANRSVQNPVWLAPEVINNELCSDKSDVYSYGVILFELLARTKFFGGIAFMSAVESLITEGVRPSLPQHNIPEYDHLLNICWAQDPISRPSFAEVLKRLDEIQSILETRIPVDPKFTETTRNSHIQLNRTNTLYTLIKRPLLNQTSPPPQPQLKPISSPQTSQQHTKPLPKTPPQIKSEVDTPSPSSSTGLVIPLKSIDDIDDDNGSCTSSSSSEEDPNN